ncbi:helix-turn-helix transcriptional regulator [Arabiibacter massiliensis]|uniref:helix-turn-helix transcriptional regulator n=1 Tax=Arabiibacter massiliensis TaxID=1870985 RepID=UPI001E3CA6F8|nr:helix-turn-helix transcriptional regulator [Arabiibacter massiliensis]
MYIVSTITFGIALLASTFRAAPARRLLARPAFVAAGGALASLGCAVIIAVGPYYLYYLLPYGVIRAAFYLGCGLTGLGTAVIGLKCGELFGRLAPRKAILYAALSHIVLALVYFTVIGSPAWQPVPGGPSLAGIVSFVGMPLAAALAACLSFVERHEGREEAPQACSESRASFPRSFWKLVAVTLVFSFVVVALRSMLVEVSPVDVTLESTRLVMLLRMLMALAFAAAAIGVEGERFDFGKIYSVIMAAVVALIAFCPIVGVTHLGWSQLVTFLSAVFEFVLWCILAFVVYQRRISAVLVFGFGYGAFMLGSGAGWAAGVHLFPQVAATSNSLVLFGALAFAVLACAFLLFSEKEFDRLFKTEEDPETSLDDLLGDELPAPFSDEAAVKKGRFGQAIDQIAEEACLSPREKDVLRCLAMGYDSGAAAKRLQVSWNTVRTHTRNVYAKLDVHSKQEVIDLVDAATKRL